MGTVCAIDFAVREPTHAGTLGSFENYSQAMRRPPTKPVTHFWLDDKNVPSFSPLGHPTVIIPAELSEKFCLTADNDIGLGLVRMPVRDLVSGLRSCSPDVEGQVADLIRF